MGLIARLLKLEQATRPSGVGVVGVVNERDPTGAQVNAVTVYPGGAQRAVAAFVAQYPPRSGPFAGCSRRSGRRSTMTG